MPIKTKEEMFGDGAGFGPAVPYSTTNAPGTGAGNRGIDFGEQLTASIANRTHYALALNDEDLNDRIAEFETDGLDAAYRGGATATAGIGRVVTLDDAAIETQSALAALYAADPLNTHFRANAEGDTALGSLGFEFKADGDPTEIISGSDFAGFLDRRAYSSPAAGFASSFGVGEAALLNPGGASATTVRLTTGGSVFWTAAAGPTPPAGNYTDLLLGVDMVEISGSTGHDGVYFVSALGSAGTDVQLVDLLGNAPTFTADDACTITVYRPRFATFGSAVGAASLSNLMIPNRLGDAALALTAGSDVLSDQHMLDFLVTNEDGSLSEASFFDQYGRWNFGLTNDALPYRYSTVDENLSLYEGGAYATHVDRTGAGSTDAHFGHIVRSNDAAPSGRLDFTSLQLVEFAGTNLDGSVPFSFNANSPTNGELDVSGASMGGDWRDYLIGHVTLCEITSPDGHEGFYWVRSTDTGPDVIRVQNLNGTTTSAFPTSGAGTMRFFYPSYVGSRAQAVGISPVDVAGGTISPGTVLTAPLEQDGVALVLAAPDISGEERALIKGFTQDTGTTANPVEVFRLDPDGTVVSRAEYEYEIARSRTIQIALVGGTPIYTGAADSTWLTLFTGGIVSQVDDCLMVFDLKQYLPSGAQIVDIRAIVDPGAARATVGDRTKIDFFSHTPDFATPAAGSNTTIATDTDDGTATIQRLEMTSLLTTLDFSTTSYFVALKAGNDGGSNNDTFWGLEITFYDPGPRND
jgi:hypothetical protein